MSNTQTAITAALKSGAVDKVKLARRYYALCDLRDAAYAEAEPIEKALEQANLEAEAARLKADELSKKVEAIWGPNWFSLKREIADIAGILRKIPPRDSLPTE
jgi:hypothetical protein